MKNLTQEQIKHLPENIKLQVSAGFRGSDLSLNPTGKDILMRMLAEEKEKELAAVAKKYLKESKEAE